MSQVRRPAVAGMFYPASPEQLAADVDGYLANAPAGAAGDVDPFVLVVPHAGYPYSGQIAADAYKAVEGKSYDVVLLLGPAHRVPFAGVATAPFDVFRTPLGDVPVDRALSARLAAAAPFTELAGPHEGEHSLEVQLPFLQRSLHPGFLVCPLVFGHNTAAGLTAAAEAIHAALGTDPRRVLVVCSTDLSHDWPYAEAVAMDQAVAGRVAALDADGLAALFENGTAEACGRDGLLVALRLAAWRGHAAARVVALRNSGDVVGDRASRIVGYLSAVIP